MKPFYSKEELISFNFLSLGCDVQISRKCSIYNPTRISIGNNVRIDDYCVLSAGHGGIFIGSNIHIAIYTSLQGEGKITLHDFVGLSSKVSIYSSNDDYFGGSLTNPTISGQFRNVIVGNVTLEKHVLIGSGAIILPNVIMHEGAVLGALSLLSTNAESFCIYKGNPANKLMRRSKKILKLEEEFINNQNQN
ncbi:MAG: acyltransferase [Bacteroidota bacterium]|nr:acyltransferase [Bacteroidota bacterium]